MYNSNLSRRMFIHQLALTTAGVCSLGFHSSCSRRHAKVQIINFYGTGTLDILESGWMYCGKECGVEVHFTDNGNDVGPVIAQMISGNASRDYDVGGLQGGAERELYKAGVIIPWDTAKLDHWELMWPMAEDIPYVKHDDKQLGIPIALNADSMIYLPDEVRKITGYESGVVDTYAAIFDERLRGRVSMEDAWINSAIFAAIYLKENNITAIGDPGNLTESELKDVMSFLIEHKKKGQFRKLWRGWEQGVELLQSQEVLVMTGWEPIVYELRRRGLNAEYANPREGYEGWSNDLVLHAGVVERGSEKVDAAHRVASWLLSGRYGCELAKLRGYAVPNDSMIKFATTNNDYELADVEKLASHVKTKFKRQGGATYWQNVRPENHRLYDEWWTKLRNT